MKLIRFLLPRLEYVVLLALFWSAAANGPKLLNIDGDLPRHLLLGQLIRETRSVPTTDTFSFRTEGFPSIPHEWLSQVILSIANDLLGLSGVVLLTAIVITAVWALVYQEAARRSNNLFLNLFILALGIAVSIIHVLPRPHIFTYLFTALWILLLERMRDKPRLWWLLPVLMLLWVNMHGMFVLGLIIWGIYLVGSWLENPSRTWFSNPFVRVLLLGGILSIFATFLSPSGIHIWEAITSLGSNAYITSRIPEYQSANFHMPETWPFIILLVLTVIGFARNTNKTNWSHILLIAAFAAIALYTSRMLPLFAIVAVPITARSLSEMMQQEFPESRYIAIEKNFATMNATSNGWIWFLVLVLAVTGLFGSGQVIDPGGVGNVFHESFFPVQAVDWLNSNPQSGHMFNEFDWGGYLLLNLSPRQQIFMDGHTHIYGEALTREYETVTFQRDGWQDIFDKYQIEWAIVRTKSAVIEGLTDMNWNILYEDDTATILRKP
jgi:hypothetical protein